MRPKSGCVRASAETIEAPQKHKEDYPEGKTQHSTYQQTAYSYNKMTQKVQSKSKNSNRSTAGYNIITNYNENRDVKPEFISFQQNHELSIG